MNLDKSINKSNSIILCNPTDKITEKALHFECRFTKNSLLQNQKERCPLQSDAPKTVLNVKKIHKRENFLFNPLAARPACRRRSAFQAK